MTYRPIIGASSVSRDYGYTAGGYTGSNSATTEKYDDIANTWTTKTDMNNARRELAGFSLNGYGYTAGGNTGSNSVITEKYDDIANTWVTKGSINVARYALAGFSLNGYGYTTGGYTGSTSAVTEKYDDIAGIWISTGIATLNTARYGLAGFSLNGYGYTAGGYISSFSTITEKYDDVTNTWTTKGSLNTARYDLAGFSLNGYGYTAGGNTGSANAITEKYDDVANTWVTKGGLNTARYYLEGFSFNGYGYTAGGYTGSYSTVTEKYDDITNVWTSTGIATLNTARFAPAGFSLGALQAGVQNPEINPIYKTINKSKIASVWLSAEAAYLPATNPATFNEVSGSTTYAGWSYLAFDDTTAQTAAWKVPLSKYDGGNIVIKAFSKPQTTPTGTVTLQYNILTIGLSTGGEFNSEVLVDTGINISHSLSTSTLSTQVQIASATIDPANVAADNILVICFSRDVVSDNLAGNGQLLGILLEYTKA